MSDNWNWRIRYFYQPLLSATATQYQNWSNIPFRSALTTAILVFVVLFDVGFVASPTFAIVVAAVVFVAVTAVVVSFVVVVANTTTTDDDITVIVVAVTTTAITSG